MDFYSEFEDSDGFCELKVCYEDITFDSGLQIEESPSSYVVPLLESPASSECFSFDNQFELFNFLTPLIQNDQVSNSSSSSCATEPSSDASHASSFASETPQNVSSIGTQCSRIDDSFVETASQCDAFTSPLEPPELPDAHFYYNIMGITRPPVYSRRSAEAVIKQWAPAVNNTDGIHLRCYEDEEEVLSEQDRVFMHSLTERISSLMTKQRRKLKKYLRDQRRKLCEWIPKRTTPLRNALPKTSVHAATKSMFPCLECYQVFSTKLSLVTHMKIHQKPFCTTCLDVYAANQCKTTEIHQCSTVIAAQDSTLEERQQQQLRARPVVVLKDIYMAPEPLPITPSPIKKEPNLSDVIVDEPYVLNVTLMQTGDNQYECKYQYNTGVLGCLKVENDEVTTLLPMAVKTEDYDSDPLFLPPSKRLQGTIRAKRKSRRRPFSKVKEEKLSPSLGSCVKKYTTRSGRNVVMCVDSD